MSKVVSLSRNVSKEEYEFLKSCLVRGMVRQTVSQLSGRSANTLRLIDRSKDFLDYRRMTSPLTATANDTQMSQGPEGDYHRLLTIAEQVKDMAKESKAEVLKYRQIAEEQHKIARIVPKWFIRLAKILGVL